MAQWIKRLHTKGEIDRSGAMLIPWWTNPDKKLTDALYEAISKKEPVTRKNLNAVLVSVASIQQLKTAYLNYYADTSEFLNALKIALEPRKAMMDSVRDANAKSQNPQ